MMADDGWLRWMASGIYIFVKVELLERRPAMVDQAARASHPMVLPTGTNRISLVVRCLVAKRKRLGADRGERGCTRLSNRRRASPYREIRMKDPWQ